MEGLEVSTDGLPGVYDLPYNLNQDSCFIVPRNGVRGSCRPQIGVPVSTQSRADFGDGKWMTTSVYHHICHYIVS